MAAPVVPGPARESVGSPPLDRALSDRFSADIRTPDMAIPRTLEAATVALELDAASLWVLPVGGSELVLVAHHSPGEAPFVPARPELERLPADWAESSDAVRVISSAAGSSVPGHLAVVLRLLGASRGLLLLDCGSRAEWSTADRVLASWLGDRIIRIVEAAESPAAEPENSPQARTLRDSEESYRTIFEASGDAIYVLDRDSGAILDVNNAACELNGYTR
jgi:PAS domain-containing protein